MLKGSVMAMLLHDVCEEIRLEELRAMLGARRAEPSFKHATPDYVRFEKPPVIGAAALTSLSSGEELRTQVKYYDYGVVDALSSSCRLKVIGSRWRRSQRALCRALGARSARRRKSSASAWGDSRQ